MAELPALPAASLCLQPGSGLRPASPEALTSTCVLATHTQARPLRVSEPQLRLSLAGSFFSTLCVLANP